MSRQRVLQADPEQLMHQTIGVYIVDMSEASEALIDIEMTVLGSFAKEWPGGDTFIEVRVQAVRL